MVMYNGKTIVSGGQFTTAVSMSFGSCMTQSPISMLTHFPYTSPSGEPTDFPLSNSKLPIGIPTSPSSGPPNHQATSSPTRKVSPKPPTLWPHPFNQHFLPLPFPKFNAWYSISRTPLHWCATRFVIPMVTLSLATSEPPRTAAAGTSTTATSWDKTLSKANNSYPRRVSLCIAAHLRNFSGTILT